MKPAKYRWYTVSLYVNTLLEGTFMVRASNHESARNYILINARSTPEWVGKRLSAESMRVKDKHITAQDVHGFVSK